MKNEFDNDKHHLVAASNNVSSSSIASLGNMTKNVSGINDGWFSETEAMYPGQKFSLALEGFDENKSILYYKQSKFQKILVLKSAQYGNVLVLDGVIQLTERDEYAYHEMMTHIPLFAHAKPQHVLIVGGGDGGILREVCKHECVQSITMIEIDLEVINVVKKYFKRNSFSEAFQDERVTIINDDASELLCDNSNFKNKFDIIIADTSDPVGPAERLFYPKFYETMYECLRDSGIVCAQSECMWIHLDYISDMLACLNDIFDFAEYCSTLVPTYPCGQIGFILAHKANSDNTPNKSLSCQRLRRYPPNDFVQKQFRYYNINVHQAAFVLPEFVRRRLEQYQGSTGDNGASNVFPYYDENNNEEEEDRCVLAGCNIS